MKLYDKVYIKHLQCVGIIDAISKSRYRIKTNDTYYWVYAEFLEPYTGQDQKKKESNQNKRDLSFFG